MKGLANNAEHPVTALEQAAKRFGDSQALSFPLSDERLTFTIWHDRSQALAKGLLGLGLRPGDHIALLAENRIEWPVVQMAVAAMGGVLVPLNSHYRRDDLAFALTHADVRAVIASRSFRTNPYLQTLRELGTAIPDLQHIITLDAGDGDEPLLSDLIDSGRKATAAPEPQAPETVGALLFTSGTTGFPKATALRHSGMMANAAGSAARLNVRPGERWTSIIPLFHCAGCIMNLLGCLQAGAAYVGVPAFDPEHMFQVIEMERCSLLSGVPTSYLAMLDHPARRTHDLTSLRTGTCGGADCDPVILRRCAQEFPIPGLCQVYGQTEVSTLATCPAPDDANRFDTAGPPLPGARVRITDTRDGRPVTVGAIGQIEVSGTMTMIGYYRDEEASEQTLSSEGWLATGDLGFMTGDGNLVISGGRLRDMIIRGGENIYPAEIEALLQTHPNIQSVAVFAIEDDYYGEAVAAAVRLADTVTGMDLIDYCKHRIAHFKVPTRFYSINEFPMTSSGKIRKTELRDMARTGVLEVLA